MSRTLAGPRSTRTYAGCYFSQGELRWLRLLALVCWIVGHRDRWIPWWSGEALRCRRCLTFRVRT